MLPAVPPAFFAAVPAARLLRQALVAAALAGPVLAAGAPAAAQTVSSADPAGLVKQLQERGQTAILTVDEFGDPFIETSSGNVDYNMLFYGCVRHAGCTSVSLRAQRMSPGEAPIEALNRWNTDQRWTKLYSADVNSVIMEMDLLFEPGGMQAVSFDAWLDLWDKSLIEFARFIDDGGYSFVE